MLVGSGVCIAVRVAVGFLHCLEVAVRLEGKSAEQIRQELAIEGDLTKEEVEAIQEEDEWDTLVERVSG